jgi:hypothetical protein
MRRRTDRLYARSLGPREHEALRLIEDRPGITVAELAEGHGRDVGPGLADRPPVGGWPGAGGEIGRGGRAKLDLEWRNQDSRA